MLTDSGMKASVPAKPTGLSMSHFQHAICFPKQERAERAKNGAHGLLKNWMLKVTSHGFFSIIFPLQKQVPEPSTGGEDCPGPGPTVSTPEDVHSVGLPTETTGATPEDGLI